MSFNPGVYLVCYVMFWSYPVRFLVLLMLVVVRC